MASRTSYRYALHPVLATFYSRWSALAGAGLPLPTPAQSLSRQPTALMFYSEMPPFPEQPDEINRQILGPLLPVFYWDAPSAVPLGVLWFKTNLTDDEVISLLVAEWLRTILLINEPVLAEMGRMVFAHILTAQQCQRHFGAKKLSQRVWGQITDLSREQLAHAAATINHRLKACERDEAKLADDDSRLNFFKERYG